MPAPHSPADYRSYRGLPTLAEARANYQAFGACEERFRDPVD